MEEVSALGWWGVPLGVMAGMLRVSTPFLFVSLGECLTEKSGRINLGLEGNLVMGAMAGYGISFVSGSPWLGVVAAGLMGMVLGAMHAWACSQPPRQRHRRRHIAYALRHWFGVFPRQTAHPADGAAPADDRLRLVERHSAAPASLSRSIFSSSSASRWRRSWRGRSPTRAGASSCERWAIAPMRRAPWAITSIACAC